MVNAILGMGNDLPQRLNEIERKIRDLSTQPLLLHASTGQDGGQGLSTDKDGLHLFNPAGVENVTLATADGSATFGGNVTASGNMNVTGTMTASNASITGNIAQSNSWGASSLGPVAFGSVGSPGLTFTKTGTTYAQPVGVGLTRNTAGTLDQIILVGPNAASPTFLILRADQTFALGGDASGVGPAVQCSQGANGTLSLYGGSTNGSININPTGTGNAQVIGNFAVTGTKAFVMDHPVHPDTMTLMHAATESDRNGVEYWGTATTDATGAVVVTLPDYFEALTKTSGRNVQLTATGPCATVPWASTITSGQFTISAPSGVNINWLVKAERQRIIDGHDNLAFPVEQDKLIVGPLLPGTTKGAGVAGW